jgi:putative tricarboxylic transport membrane protein
MSVIAERAIGIAALVLAGVMGIGATQIPADAGYAGVGPNFLPWVVAAALAACGIGLVTQAFSGGFRQREAPSGADRGDWPPLLWVAAGVLANAALITTAGFILACTVCYMLAVRGLRQSEGKTGRGVKGLVMDFVTGFLIAGPAFWLFTKVLKINLPGLTATGWI